ncbi:MAG: DUF58 domain-containing protein [Pseudomonadales bacterium]|nr:DUF58 domain-containing protein [Pseudomonadales bacterium]
MILGAYAKLDDLLGFRTRHFGAKTPRRARTRMTGGHRRSKMRGRGMDFAEVRLYQSGDDVRTIDWRVSARKAKTHTKIFEEERERPTLILCDQTQSMFFGSINRLKSVAAAEVSAVLAWHTLNQGNRVGGLVLDNQTIQAIKPRRSVRTLVRFLNLISEANQKLNRNTRQNSAENYFSRALAQLKKTAHNGHQIYIVSDFRTPFDLWKPHMLALSRHNDLTLILISDPLEATLPPANLYAITDGQSRNQIDTGNKQLRDRYQQRYQEFHDQIQSFCQSYGMHFEEISTAEAAEENLANHLINYSG